MIALHLSFEPSFDTTARVYVHNTITIDGEIDPDFDVIVDSFYLTDEEQEDWIDGYDNGFYVDEYALIPSPDGKEASWIAYCEEVSPRFAAWLDGLRHAVK